MFYPLDTDCTVYTTVYTPHTLHTVYCTSHYAKLTTHLTLRTTNTHFILHYFTTYYTLYTNCIIHNAHNPSWDF